MQIIREHPRQLTSTKSSELFNRNLL